MEREGAGDEASGASRGDEASDADADADSGASRGDEASDADADSGASSGDEASDTDAGAGAGAGAGAPVVTQLSIEGDEDCSRLVAVGRGAQRRALRLTLAQRTSGSEFLMLDVAFLPPLHMPGLADRSLVHFSSFSECAEVVSGLAHQRRAQEGAPRRRRGAGRAAAGAPAGAPGAPPERVPVAVLSECTFKILRLGPLVLQIKTRRQFGAIMSATAHVLLDQRLRFTADYSDVPRVPGPAGAAHHVLQATVAETLGARPGQRYQLSVYCEGEPGRCEHAQPARAIARGRWQPDLPTEQNFIRIAVEVYSRIAAQDRLAAARA